MDPQTPAASMSRRQIFQTFGPSLKKNSAKLEEVEALLTDVRHDVKTQRMRQELHSTTTRIEVADLQQAIADLKEQHQHIEAKKLEGRAQDDLNQRVADLGDALEKVSNTVQTGMRRDVDAMYAAQREQTELMTKALTNRFDEMERQLLEASGELAGNRLNQEVVEVRTRVENSERKVKEVTEAHLAESVTFWKRLEAAASESKGTLRRVEGFQQQLEDERNSRSADTAELHLCVQAVERQLQTAFNPRAPTPCTYHSTEDTETEGSRAKYVDETPTSAKAPRPEFGSTAPLEPMGCLHESQQSDSLVEGLPSGRSTEHSGSGPDAKELWTDLALGQGITPRGATVTTSCTQRSMPWTPTPNEGPSFCWSSPQEARLAALTPAETLPPVSKLSGSYDEVATEMLTAELSSAEAPAALPQMKMSSGLARPPTCASAISVASVASALSAASAAASAASGDAWPSREGLEKELMRHLNAAANKQHQGQQLVTGQLGQFDARLAKVEVACADLLELAASLSTMHASLRKGMPLTPTEVLALKTATGGGELAFKTAASLGSTLSSGGDGGDGGEDHLMSRQTSAPALRHSVTSTMLTEAVAPMTPLSPDSRLDGSHHNSMLSVQQHRSDTNSPGVPWRAAVDIPLGAFRQAPSRMSIVQDHGNRTMGEGEGSPASLSRHASTAAAVAVHRQSPPHTGMAVGNGANAGSLDEMAGATDAIETRHSGFLHNSPSRSSTPQAMNQQSTHPQRGVSPNHGHTQAAPRPHSATSAIACQQQQQQQQQQSLPQSAQMGSSGARSARQSEPRRGNPYGARSTSPDSTLPPQSPSPYFSSVDLQSPRLENRSSSLRRMSNPQLEGAMLAPNAYATSAEQASPLLGQRSASRRTMQGIHQEVARARQQQHSPHPGSASWASGAAPPAAPPLPGSHLGVRKGPTTTA
eukprot:NODE_269_length_3254_cov_4.184842.p1 GENE.NODE_269_length_3254_cov_4.184842~~NODE_269_length_3254_cov_4.184842.p1  ORF type:complete len:932 (+),score=96.03 NODE_269_length_3254_cov_4.184842:145-2940(+)